MTTTYIALLRGINVGGKKKMPMADLRQLLEKSGYVNIRTYIQSGNILFEIAEQAYISQLESHLAKIIEDHFGFAVPVMVKSFTHWQEVVFRNPFLQKEDTMDHLYLTWLKAAPSSDVLQAADPDKYLPDRFYIQGDAVYVYCAGKYHESKLSNAFFEKQLDVTATTRNWKTVVKLQDMALGN